MDLSILRYYSMRTGLSAIKSQLFSYRDRLFISGRQYFASALQRGGVNSKTNSADKITVNVDSLDTKSYTTF